MRGSKDAALAMAMRAFLNARLRTVGEITELSLNTAERRSHMRVALRGERRPVDVSVRSYTVDEADGQHWLTILDAGASCAWLEGMVRHFAVGHPFPLSPTAARVLRVLT
jgi:hypothetical protein